MDASSSGLPPAAPLAACRSHAPLLPAALRLPGWILCAAGAAASVVRFGCNWQPELLQGKAFALCSVYFRARFLTVIDNNYSEEMCGILLLAGLVLIAFTKERVETCGMDALRLRALVIALYVNSAFIVLSFLLLFGLAFVGVLAANLFSTLIAYVIVFRILLFRSRRSSLTTPGRAK